MDEYKESLSEKGITFSYDEKACALLAKNSIGGKSGARDLRNLIRKEVEDKITTALIDNESIIGITVTEKNGNIDLLILWKTIDKFLGGVL